MSESFSRLVNVERAGSIASGKKYPEGEYHKGEVRRGEWQTKVVSVIPEMECHTSRGLPDLGRTHI